MQTFYEGWRIVQALIESDGNMPKEVLLPDPRSARRFRTEQSPRRGYQRNLILEPSKVLGQLSVIRRLSLEPRKNVLSVPESAKRLVARASPRFDHGHMPVTYSQIALSVGISGVGGGEALADREHGFIAVERGKEIALSLEHIADFPMRDGEIALPEGA